MYQIHFNTLLEPRNKKIFILYCEHFKSVSEFVVKSLIANVVIRLQQPPRESISISISRMHARIHRRIWPLSGGKRNDYTYCFMCVIFGSGASYDLWCGERKLWVSHPFFIAHLYGHSWDHLSYYIMLSISCQRLYFKCRCRMQTSRMFYVIGHKFLNIYY